MLRKIYKQVLNIRIKADCKNQFFVEYFVKLKKQQSETKLKKGEGIVMKEKKA